MPPHPLPQLGKPAGWAGRQVVSIRVCAPPGAQVGGRISCGLFTWRVGGTPHLARASLQPFVTLGPAVLRLGNESPSSRQPSCHSPWTLEHTFYVQWRIRAVVQDGGGGSIDLQLRALQDVLTVALVGDLELQTQVLSLFADIHLHRWGGRSSEQAHRCVPDLGRGVGGGVGKVDLILSNFFL